MCVRIVFETERSAIFIDGTGALVVEFGGSGACEMRVEGTVVDIKVEYAKDDERQQIEKRKRRLRNAECGMRILRLRIWDWGVGGGRRNVFSPTTPHPPPPTENPREEVER
ncbi:MAG: hypothetical protein ACR2GW_01340, partial [Pyrinomonadaceae bacterium]